MDLVRFDNNFKLNRPALVPPFLVFLPQRPAFISPRLYKIATALAFYITTNIISKQDIINKYCNTLYVYSIHLRIIIKKSLPGMSRERLF
jgi:hypothetical protein